MTLVPRSSLRSLNAQLAAMNVRTQHILARSNFSEPPAEEKDIALCCLRTINQPNKEVTWLCPVCLDDFDKGEERTWPAGCGHNFCASCLDACLTHSARCPICRSLAPGEYDELVAGSLPHDIEAAITHHTCYLLAVLDDHVNGGASTWGEVVAAATESHLALSSIGITVHFDLPRPDYQALPRDRRTRVSGEVNLAATEAPPPTQAELEAINAFLESVRTELAALSNDATATQAGSLDSMAAVRAELRAHNTAIALFMQARPWMMAE